MFGLLGIGSLKVVLISTRLASKDWWGVNTYQSYKENFTNWSNYSYRWSKRGKDTIGTGLVSTIGRLKKIYRRIKNKEWFIDANIRVAFGYFLWKHHCQAKAPSVFGFLKRNRFIAYYNRLIEGIGWINGNRVSR